MPWRGLFKPPAEPVVKLYGRDLDALAIDEPLEYARLYLDGNMQMWVDATNSLEIW